jgi:3-isopropylmalate/(R)-2-methylmalate dehydratase small subunit
MKAISGRAWILGDDIDTDVLAPGLYMKGPIAEMARHCLESVEPDFAAQVAEGDIIVAGANFGIGSSREQAAEVLTLLGVKAVVAKSFGGIFYRNALNFGLLAVTSAADLQIIAGDIVSVDGVAGIIVNERTGETFACNPTPQHLMAMVNAGGLVAHLEQRLAAQKEMD